MPIRRAVLMMRQAISPRLAIRMRLNMRRATQPLWPRWCPAARRLAAATAESQSAGSGGERCLGLPAPPVRLDPFEDAQVSRVIAGRRPGGIDRSALVACGQRRDRGRGLDRGGMHYEGASPSHLRLPVRRAPHRPAGGYLSFELVAQAGLPVHALFENVGRKARRAHGPPVAAPRHFARRNGARDRPKIPSSASGFTASLRKDFPSWLWRRVAVSTGAKAFGEKNLNGAANWPGSGHRSIYVGRTTGPVSRRPDV